MGPQETIDSWRVASVDLGIEIQSPFILKTSDGEEIKFELLIKRFGSELGTLIFSTDELFHFKTAQKYGYYCSALNPENYSVYKKELFVDTLNDWGFFGKSAEQPKWYTGLRWS